MTLSPLNSAQRRYRMRIVIAALAYSAMLMLEQHLLHTSISITVRFVCAILPALGIVAMFAALGAYLVEEQDEFLRVRITRQIVWGTGIALSAGTLYGFPEDAGLLPHMPFYFIAIFWFAGFGLAGCVEKVLGR